MRKALDVVRKVQGAPLKRRRALFANPRAFLQEALGDGADDALVDQVFRETATYSERVLGLGLWSPRVLPWIKLPPSNWFGEDKEEGRAQNPAPATAGGLMVGDRAIPLSTEEAIALQQRVEDAIGAERPTVALAVEGQTVQIPANYETLTALENLRSSRDRERQAPQPRKKNGAQHEVLLIQPNENDVENEGEFSRRAAYSHRIPESLASTLKRHQQEGLLWLQKSWSIGRPGVLLADDMGLGKTIQGLAFLAWLREGMQSAAIERDPFLVVAPTGLLQNWKAEHARHLAQPGLGNLVEAFGRGLSSIKCVDSDGRPGLDVKKLQQADWVLTTYETLRTFDKDFGAVRFAVLMFDEAQKIKTPGIRLTDAAKAMNADFRIALTGTPVENRLSDLWCITDAIHPAVLGDLKSFSAEYERQPDTERLKKLKCSLDAWHGGRPPLLLRRLKQDRLPDIPQPNEIVSKVEMPALQRAAYESAIGQARDGRRAGQSGAVLRALHELRKCSLHPDRESALSDKDFISASARLSLAFEALDQAAATKERVLVFLNDLDMQARLVGLIQRRYSLATPPMVINGTVAGADRQSRVDRFQSGPDEFDAMILSPQAGGVGLTLTRANHVIHLARWWNPAVEDQCTGRALRIGQDKTVHIHIPIATLGDGRPSFDENLHALLDRKRQLMNEALVPPEATTADLDLLLDASL